jgi:hypothetical protein
VPKSNTLINSEERLKNTNIMHIILYMKDVIWNNEKEEKELIESVERGEWKSIENYEKEK